MNQASETNNSGDQPQFDLGDFVRRVLAEDMGSGGDVTSRATIDAGARFTATMNCREPMVVAGLDVAIAFFRALDPEVGITADVADGDKVDAGTELVSLDGKARAMLTAERSALNTLQHLSGIATSTRTRDELQSFNRIEIDGSGVRVTIQRWDGTGFVSGDSKFFERHDEQWEFADGHKVEAAPTS